MTYRQLQTFYVQRIQPLFKEGSYYGGLITGTMSQQQMEIRNSHLTFRTSSKGASMEGVDIDFLSLDEYDRLSSSAETSAIESMSSSKYQFVRRWSTPTFPHYGIHHLYETSDQREWVHKCEHCGYVQKLDYEKNIELVNPKGIDPVGKVVQPNTYRFICQKCGKPLDRWSNGHWEVTHAGSGRRHGYSLSGMDAVWIKHLSE